MATPVIMPRQGQSVESCIITKWYKSKGDKIAVNDLLFSYETDKAAFEMEAPAEGILLETFFDEGAEVPVLINVAVIGQPGEAIGQFFPGSSSPPEKDMAGAAEESEEKTSSVPVNTEVEISPGISDDERIRISPRARKFAFDKGVEIINITGSGPNGRIVFADIENAISKGIRAPAMTVASVTSEEFTEQPVSNIRKIIAKAMHSSLQNSAQLTHHMSADVRRLLDARTKIKEGLASGKEKHDITLNDMICWCVIRALKKFPEANAHFLGDKIKTFNPVHLGIAVDTPRGLMVPAVKHADRMDIRQLSAGLRSAADACRKGNIDPELIQSTSASFTVSNLGNYGVEMFTPVINLPQVCILGVCTIINRPADIGNNTFGFVPYMGLSLTYDHRAIDGGPATSFLRE
ncbi:MAG TPA: dihydrolipoamide acetyltransferase family protein, partial [Bacteroidales bacterium]|nr:dihydrolipoamide acetyltransferase family protein [Bacteroidales bacterium]